MPSSCTAAPGRRAGRGWGAGPTWEDTLAVKSRRETLAALPMIPPIDTDASMFAGSVRMVLPAGVTYALFRASGSCSAVGQAPGGQGGGGRAWAQRAWGIDDAPAMHVHVRRRSHAQCRSLPGTGTTAMPAQLTAHGPCMGAQLRPGARACWSSAAAAFEAAAGGGARWHRRPRCPDARARGASMHPRRPRLAVSGSCYACPWRRRPRIASKTGGSKRTAHLPRPAAPAAAVQQCVPAPQHS
jgi:hypothetical protein